MFKQARAVFGNMVLTYGVQIVTSILIARLLGPQQKGALGVAMLVAGVMSSLAHLGLPSALMYNLPQGDDRREAIEEGLSVCLWLAPLMLFIIGAAYTGAYWFGRNNLLRGLSSALVLGSLVFCITALAQQLLVNFLNGLQDFRWRNIVSLISPLPITVVLIGAWINSMTVTPLELLWIYIASTILAAAAGVSHLIVQYRPRLRFSLREGWKQRYVTYGLKLQLTYLAQNLNYRLDSLILNALAGNAAVGIYSVGVAAAETLLFVPNATALVLLPRISAETRPEKRRVAVLTLGASLYLVLGSGIVLALFLPWIITHLYGRAFAGAIPAAAMLLPGMLSLTVLKNLASAVAGLGRPEYVTYATGLGLAITVGLDFWLIPGHGIMGCALASVIAYTLSAATMALFFLRLEAISARVLLRDLLVEPVRWFGVQVSRRQPASRLPIG